MIKLSIFFLLMASLFLQGCEYRRPRTVRLTSFSCDNKNVDIFFRIKYNYDMVGEVAYQTKVLWGNKEIFQGNFEGKFPPLHVYLEPQLDGDLLFDGKFFQKSDVDKFYHCLVSHLSQLKPLESDDWRSFNAFEQLRVDHFFNYSVRGLYWVDDYDKFPVKLECENKEFLEFTYQGKVNYVFHQQDSPPNWLSGLRSHTANAKNGYWKIDEIRIELSNKFENNKVFMGPQNSIFDNIYPTISKCFKKHNLLEVFDTSGEVKNENR